MTGYLFFFFSIILISILGKNQRNLSLLLAFLLMTLFVGLRYNVGTDYENYSMIYDSYSTFLEPGFQILVNWLNERHLSSQWLFFIMAALTYAFLYAGLKLFEGVKIPLTLFLLTICTYSFICNGIRQALAMSVFFFSYYFIVKRKIVFFVICIFFAALFHSSSLILLPLYFVLNYKIPTKFCYIIYFLSFIFLFIDVGGYFTPYTNIGEDYENYEKYMNYVEKYDGYLGPGVIMEIINYAVIFVAAINAELHKKRPALFNLFLLCTITMNMRVGVPIMIRIQEYFVIFTYIMIPLVIYDIRNIRFRFILSAFFVLYIGAATIMYIFFTPNGRMYPYHDVLGVF